MKKQLLILSLLLCLVLLLTGCKSYKDTNGPDDYSLQSLTEGDILKGGSSTKIGSVSSQINNKYKVSVKTLHGVDTLETFSGKGSYQIELSWTVSKGNARLVLCTDKEILHDFTVNEAGQTYSFRNDGSKVYLRIAGEDCGFSLDYTVYRS